MRKKIIIGIAASLFAVAGLFGVNTMNQNSNSDISLSSIAVMTQAQAEAAGGGGGNTEGELRLRKDRCSNYNNTWACRYLRYGEHCDFFSSC